MEINQQLCKPVGEYVEAIWDDAMDYIRRQESAVPGCDIIHVDVENELKRHKYSIESHDGPTFNLAHEDLNQIVQARQEKEHHGYGENSYYTYKLQIRDIYINAIPTEITIYEDPINASMPEQMYKMKFRTHVGKKTLTMPNGMTLDDIVIFLNGKSLIPQPVGSKGALANIIQAFQRVDEIKISKEIEALGFFLVDGNRIVASHIEIKDHTVKEIKEAAIFINELVNKFHRIDVISTGIHWGMMSPFDYVLKQYTDEMIWIQWLGCSGRTQAGKSTIGRVACGIWGNYNSSRYNVQFTSVNREATLGRKLSESTLPINVQETEDLT